MFPPSETEFYQLFGDAAKRRASEANFVSNTVKSFHNWEHRAQRIYRSLTVLLVVTNVVVFFKPAWDTEKLSEPRICLLGARIGLLLGKLGIDAPISIFVGIGQSAAGHMTANARVV